MSARPLAWSFHGGTDAGLAAARRGTGSPAALRAAVFAEAPSALLLTDATPEDLLAVRTLRAPMLWDLAGLPPGSAERLRTDAAWRDAFAQAIARADSVANADAALRLAAEDMLGVGLPALGMAEALAQLDRPVAVAVGSGLGNMLNATPMIRWIAERTGRRVTVVIHGSVAQGVQLFAGAPWVDFVFPGFEYCAGRHYHVLVQTTLAAHMEPLCTADRWIQQHKLVDFNLHGRFVREADLFFAGLADAFGPTPQPDDPLPAPFVRDLAAAPEHERVIGLANGIKQGIWAKRQWDKTAELAARLAAEGWTLRCFGMPEELVPHAEDFTGLSIRATAAAIARCAYFIGHDGGMCHLAEKLGVPTLWLFGPTGRIKNGRWFEQSGMLTALAPCSPCNFKLDWLRCADPACMAEIGVEDALAGFALVREKTERLGRRRVWAEVDRPDIARELRAPDLPARPPGDRREAAERVLALPGHAATAVRVLAGLLRAGDLRGAATLAAATSRFGRPDLAVRELGAAASLLAGHGPGTAGPREPELALDALAMLQLAPADLRASVEALALALVAAGRGGEVPELFGRMARRLDGTLGTWAMRRWVATTIALTPGELRRRAAELRLTCRPSREATELLRRATEEAAILAEAAAARADAPADTPLAPGRAGLPALGSPPIRLDLPGGAVSLPRWSTVVLLAPALDPAALRAGSAGRMVVLAARSLAALGLCPVVASGMQATDRPLFELRDNVTFLNGARSWRPDTWRAILGGLAPRLVIGLDGAEAATGLAEGALRFGLQGLYDREGLAEVIGTELSLDPPREGAADAPPLDRLLDALPVPPGGRAPPRASGAADTRVVLLVNDAGDVGLALDVVRRCPDLPFLMVADVLDRGPEPNLSFLPRRRAGAWGEVAERMGCLVQVASRPGGLTAEAVLALRAGTPVLAATDRQPRAGLAAPATPGDAESWVAALRGLRRVRMAAA